MFLQNIFFDYSVLNPFLYSVFFTNANKGVVLYFFRDEQTFLINKVLYVVYYSVALYNIYKKNN